MKRFARVILISCALFAAVLVVNKIRFHYGWKDAFARTLLTPFVRTTWPDSFSETAFAKVKIGMYERDVEALLIGNPIRKERYAKGGCWYYADQDSDNLPYDRRWIAFDASHRVIRIRHEFYID